MSKSEKPFGIFSEEEDKKKAVVFTACVEPRSNGINRIWSSKGALLFMPEFLGCILKSNDWQANNFAPLFIRLLVKKE